MTTPTPSSPVTRILIVSRHPATIRWLLARARGPAEVVSHLRPSDVRPGDQVVGTLPVSLAAEVCARGAALWQVCFEMPAAYRGLELSDQILADLAPCIRRFDVFLSEGGQGGPFNEPHAVSAGTDTRGIE